MRNGDWRRDHAETNSARNAHSVLNLARLQRNNQMRLRGREPLPTSGHFEVSPRVESGHARASDEIELVDEEVLAVVWPS